MQAHFCSFRVRTNISFAAENLIRLQNYLIHDNSNSRPQETALEINQKHGCRYLSNTNVAELLVITSTDTTLPLRKTTLS